MARPRPYTLVDMPIDKSYKSAVAAIVFLSAATAQAEQLPLWEAGVGAAALSFPDYRGSAKRRDYLLPVPVFVYRGEFLQADRERIRGLMYKSDVVEVDVSLNGSVPIKSHDNPARQGMPDLDPTLEIGPSLSVKLYETTGNRLTLRLPLRAVVASDFRSVHGAGALANPNLNLDIRAAYGWRVGLVGGVLLADRKYHEYFYGVAPEYAREGRPAYRAPGGYSGAQFVAALSRRFEPVWVAGFIKYDVLNGAAFEASPLVEKRKTVAAGVVVTWAFAKSKTLVERRE
jgi:MipA family protein